MHSGEQRHPLRDVFADVMTGFTALGKLQAADNEPGELVMLIVEETGHEVRAEGARDDQQAGSQTLTAQFSSLRASLATTTTRLRRRRRSCTTSCKRAIPTSGRATSSVAIRTDCGTLPTDSATRSGGNRKTSRRRMLQLRSGRWSVKPMSTAFLVSFLLSPPQHG